MYRSFYENLTFAWLPTAATLFFVAVFTVALLRLYVFKRSKDFEQVASLPLDPQEGPR